MAKKESAGFNTPFERLKLVGKPATPQPSKPPAAKQPPPVATKSATPAAKATPTSNRGESEDDRYFEQATRGVTPLDNTRGRRTSPLGAPPPPPAPRLRAASRHNDDAAAQAELVELVRGGGRGPHVVDEGSGGDRRQARQLRDGVHEIEARLDLHGYSRDEASDELERFILQSVSLGYRCVLVIHGRGLNSGDAGPVLRNMVRDTLAAGRLAEMIVAFTPAAPAQGGAGATLVRLRKGKTGR